MDSIENIKKIYIYFEIISIIAFWSMKLLIKNKAKNNEDALKKFKIILIVQCIVLVILGSTLLIFDHIYDSQKFGKFYEALTEEEKSKINFSSLKSITEINNSKSAYINENIQSYKFFQIKALILMAIYIFLMFLNILKIYKITIKIYKHNKLMENDKVLFDDEENVKF